MKTPSDESDPCRLLVAKQEKKGFLHRRQSNKGLSLKTERNHQVVVPPGVRVLVWQVANGNREKAYSSQQGD